MNGLAVTTFPKTQQIQRQWHLMDAQDVPLGRLCTKAAGLLRGKHKPTFSPHIDAGDFVVVVNAEKVRLTGNKLQDKIKFTHSGYPRGAKFIPYTRLKAEHPERLISWAVSGMLPKNKLHDRMLTRLKVYIGSQHPHAAGKPVKI